MKKYLILAAVLFAGLASAGHAQYNLQELRNDINNNLAIVPSSVMNLFGNDRINIYLEDSNFTVVTSNGRIELLEEGLLDDPTINVYTTTGTLKNIASGRLSFSTALQNGSLRYEATNVFTKVKLIVTETLASFFSLF